MGLVWFGRLHSAFKKGLVQFGWVLGLPSLRCLKEGVGSVWFGSGSVLPSSLLVKCWLWFGVWFGLVLPFELEDRTDPDPQPRLAKQSRLVTTAQQIGGPHMLWMAGRTSTLSGSNSRKRCSRRGCGRGRPRLSKRRTPPGGRT